MEALEPHEQKMKAIVGQADRIRQLQIANIDALFACEKKMAEDENKAQLEFFKQRLIDTIEEKQKKAAKQAGRRGSGADAKGGSDAVANGKRKRGEASASGAAAYQSPFPAAYALKPEESKVDLEEMNTNLDHYSVRSAAMGGDDPRNAAGSADAYFDRNRQLLYCNNNAFERGATVYVYSQGQRVDDTWTLTAMNAVEVTLRDSESTKLKVTVAQLRNGRYAFRPAPSY